MEIYAAFTLWQLLILFTGIGVYRLWAKIAPQRYIDWALLPGTLVSEMAYIFGCLITGGEVRRARLLPGSPGGKAGGASAGTETAGGVKVLGPIVASLLVVVACTAAILLLRKWLGQQIVETFCFSPAARLPEELPRSADRFWDQLGLQISLLRRMCQTWADLHWTNWRAPLFVYLTACLAVRMGSTNKPVRPTLAAAVLLAALIGLIGLISERFHHLMSDVWPLLTYIWASLLFLLAVTLVLNGAVRLGRIMMGRGQG